MSEMDEASYQRFKRNWEANCMGPYQEIMRARPARAMSMPTAGSRFNLLAQADRRTGGARGWFKTWLTHASTLNAKYEQERAEWRRVTPLINSATGLPIKD